MDLHSFLRLITHAPEEDEGDLFITSFGEGLSPVSINCALNVDEAVEAVEKLKSQPGRNVYWSSWLRRPGIQGRGGEQDLTVGLAIVVDLDHPQAVATYRDKIFSAPFSLMPTAIVRTSSDRYQLIYVLGEPCADKERWREAAHRLEAWFGADHCTHDPSHVWRMPFTINNPNAKKRAEGRVQEMSVLVEMDETRMFDIEDIIEYLPEADTPAGYIEGPLPTPGEDGLSQQWTDPIEIVRLIDSPIQADMLDNIWPPDRDRSQFDYQVCKEAVKAGLTASDVYWLYAMSTDKAFTEKAREKGFAAERYLMTTYMKAARSVEDEPPPQLPVPAEPQQEDHSKITFSLREILERPVEPIEYWIKPWLPKTGIVMVHGVAGTGKTYFMLYQLYGLLSGVAYGGFSLHEGAPPRVLYVDFEQGDKTVIRRAHQVTRACGTRGIDNLFITNTALQLDGRRRRFYADQQEGRDIVHRQIEMFRPDIVVLDNARVAMRGMDENAKSGWDMWNDWMMELRDEFGVQVIWLHHDNKPSRDNFTTYAGSSHAITTVEQEIQLLRPPQSFLDKASLIGKKYGNIVRNVVELNYGKVRDSDEPLKGCYLQFVEDEMRRGIVHLTRYSDEVTEWVQKVIGSMEQDQAAYILNTGKFGDCIAYSLRDIGTLLNSNRQTVNRMIKALRDDKVRLDETEAKALKLM